MTEDDAKTKWCPMSRSPYVSGDGTAGVNRDANGGIDKCDSCIGSGCMMWRWFNGVTVHGYCGLAGKPQE